jgi:hypothetical protein
MKKLYLLLLLSSCIQAGDQPQKSYQLGTIPILNAPVKIVQRNWTPDWSALLLTGSTCLHGTLAATSTANSIKARAIQHALLWTASHGIGALQTFTHELGHAVSDYNRGANNLEIEIWGDSITTLITGRYGGWARRQIKEPSIKTHDDAAKITTKEDFLEYAALYDTYKYNEIKTYLAGPISGTLSGYGIFKLIQKKYPVAFKNRWFKGMCLAEILLQQVRDLTSSNPECDGQKVYKAWQQKCDTARSKEIVKNLPDNAYIQLKYKS